MKSHHSGAQRASVLALLLFCCSGQSAAVTFANSNFTMMDADGVTFGGTNDVTGSWDETLNTAVTNTNFNMSIQSGFDFFGSQWTAHHIRVFGRGNYAFDSSCTVGQIEAGQAVCSGGPNVNLDVGANQVGAHLLWDWFGHTDIDIVLLWDFDGMFVDGVPDQLYVGPAGPSPSLDTVYQLVSRDVDADGIPGAKMVDGPFEGFSANYNMRTAVPVPAAAWLFGSGILGLVGLARRRG